MASRTIHLLSALLLAASAVLGEEAAQVTTGELGDATQNLDNPMGAAYRAVVSDNKMGITGSITAISAGDKGTAFAVNMANLPEGEGPFLYHLHVDPVASDGNCSSTLAHLDPFIRGEVEPCTQDRPETCQVGDLSGKHGKPEGTTFNASYIDPFVSLKEGMGAFFGNRSFVIHYPNKTRIACGNFSALSAEDMPLPSMLSSMMSEMPNPTEMPMPSMMSSMMSEMSSKMSDMPMPTDKPSEGGLPFDPTATLVPAGPSGVAGMPPGLDINNNGAAVTPTPTPVGPGAAPVPSGEPAQSVAPEQFTGTASPSVASNRLLLFFMTSFLAAPWYLS